MSDDSGPEILYQALASPHGVVLRVTDYASIEARLIRHRRQDPELAGLVFSRSVHDPHELWISKRGPKAPALESP